MDLPKGTSPPQPAANENHNSMNVQVNNDGVYTQKEINKNNNTQKKIESQKELVIVVAYNHNADTFIN